MTIDGLTLFNAGQMLAFTVLLLAATREWWRALRVTRERVALALIVTDLALAAVGIIRLVQAATGTTQRLSDVAVWIFALAVAVVQFALSRGWFLDGNLTEEK